MFKTATEKLLVTTTGTMGLLGGYNGYKMSKQICFQNKDPSSFETIGECFCFSAIVLSNSYLYAGMTPIVMVTLPISLPTFVYYNLCYNETPERT